MYMNRFIIGILVGVVAGAMGVWYFLASEKDKRKAKCYVKSFIS